MYVSFVGGVQGLTGRDSSLPQSRGWRPYDKNKLDDFSGSVHVWRIALDELCVEFECGLGDEERVRACRFVRPEDRRRFVVGRSVLRVILAQYAQGSSLPSGLRFGYERTGKPFLLDDPGLYFNLSHSENVAVVAVTRFGPVGVDIERQRHIQEMASVARLMFTVSEIAAIDRCPLALRKGLFFRTWTAKEALLKGIGVGIAGLDNPNASWLADASSVWDVAMLPTFDNYVVALAHHREDVRIHCWTWPGIDDLLLA